MKRTRMPRDVNQRAKAILDMVTGEREADPEPEKTREPSRAGGVAARSVA